MVLTTLLLFIAGWLFTIQLVHSCDDDSRTSCLNNWKRGITVEEVDSGTFPPITSDKDCSGFDVYKSCINPLGTLCTEDLPVELKQIIKKYDYICGDGFQDHLKYGECLRGGGVKGAVKTCRETMEEKQRGFTTVLSSQKCDDAKEMLLCVGDAAQTFCNAESVDHLTNLEACYEKPRADAGDPDGYECDLRCEAKTTTTTSGLEKTNPTIDTTPFPVRTTTEESTTSLSTTTLAIIGSVAFVVVVCLIVIIATCCHRKFIAKRNEQVRDDSLQKSGSINNNNTVSPEANVNVHVSPNIEFVIPSANKAPKDSANSENVGYSDTEVILPAITNAREGSAGVYNEICENNVKSEYDNLKYYKKESDTYMEPVDNAPYLRITNP